MGTRMHQRPIRLPVNWACFLRKIGKDQTFLVQWLVTLVCFWIILSNRTICCMPIWCFDLLGRGMKTLIIHKFFEKQSQASPSIWVNQDVVLPGDEFEVPTISSDWSHGMLPWWLVGIMDWSIDWECFSQPIHKTKSQHTCLPSSVEHSPDLVKPISSCLQVIHFSGSIAFQNWWSVFSL